MLLPSCLTLDEITDAAMGNGNIGFCINCGEEHYGLEPDARDRHCDNCGNATVFGAEELLIMYTA